LTADQKIEVGKYLWDGNTEYDPVTDKLMPANRAPAIPMVCSRSWIRNCCRHIGPVRVKRRIASPTTALPIRSQKRDPAG